MQISRTLLLAGASALTLAGVTSLAMARTDDSHAMTVQLPNGAVDQIRYTGDVAPRVILTPDASPFMVSSGIADPFAMMRRIAAIMDQQAAQMMQVFDAMSAAPIATPLTQAAAGSPPPGADIGALPLEADFGALPPRVHGYSVIPPDAHGYSMISTVSGSGVCIRGMQITYTGNGRPHVVTQTAGDCGGGHGAAVPAQLPPTQVPSHDVKTIQVKANGATPYQGIVHQVADWQR